MASQYGRTLNPYRGFRTPLGAKGIRQSVVITHNPSIIDATQQILVRFPNLGPNDVIVPGTSRLAFTISLTSTDANRTVVQNLGRAIIKDIRTRINGNEVMAIGNSDVFNCYSDLWKTNHERHNAVYQGIDTSEDQNATKIRIGASDKDETILADKAIADAYGKRFCIPLDFELLETHMPFYQSALEDRLEYELTFNDYNRVIKATGDTEAIYAIENISLEYDMITEPELARLIRTQYAGRLPIYFDRVRCKDKMLKDKSDTEWTINLNVPARSMKGILMLFEDPIAGGAPWARDSEDFYNPKITKVEVTIEGVPNQLYSKGMFSYQHWDEARKLFGAGSKRHPETGNVIKDLELADVTVGEFLTSKYALWMDLRVTDDDQLHGSGLKLQNTSEGVTLHITKKAEAAGKLNVYLYYIMDAQLNLEEGRYVSVLY